ncbi:MAG: hypothetical protein MUO42_12290 [Anaerolineaceae bacterium]|nr:hypothetical protein [Anaerolineaceae bacterium]
MNVYREEHLFGNARTRGEYVSARLQDMQNWYPSIGDVRGLGLFQFIELVKNRQTKPSFPGKTALLMA